MNAIQKKTKEAMESRSNGSPTMQQYIRQMQGEIKKALPSVMTPERFSRIVLSALSANPKLAETTPQSFLGAMMTAAQLGVEPNTPLGQAYLIPYWNGKAKVLASSSSATRDSLTWPTARARCPPLWHRWYMRTTNLIIPLGLIRS